MKKIILTFLLFSCFGNFTLAQNWKPLNTTEKYNFQNNTANYVSNTLWVDSIEINGTDSIFYLNRVVLVCDTCQSSISLYPEFKLKNQGQFLQKQMVKKSDGDFCFEGNSNFVLKPYANLGIAWLADTLNNISAEIILLEEQMIFGNVDSVKTIQFSNGKEIILSKNHGILFFTDFENEVTYDLVGIEGRDIGTVVPDIFDFYNFEVGDVFQYRYDYANCVPCFYINRLWKETIISKEVYPDSIVYEREVIENGWSSSITEEFIIYFDTTHPTNYYNLELTPNPSEDNDIYKDHASSYIDDNGLVTKIFGTSYEASFGGEIALNYVNASTTNNDLLMTTDGGTFHVYKEGLGEVMNLYQVFETTSSLILEGHVKDGDTTGVVLSDIEIMTSLNDLKYDDLTFGVSPNPFYENAQITFSKNTTERLLLQVFSFSGQLIFENEIPKGSLTYEINRNELNDGMYMLKVIGEEVNGSKKIVIQK